jgi:transforming growth factor-beta-induced protein
VNTSRITRRRSRLVLTTIASLSLVAAACGGDDDDAVPATDAPAQTTAAPETTMADDMTGMDMESTAFGPACSAVPADGEGSFSGMADDPAATAASNNPVLSTLVTAVTQAGLVDTLNGEGPFTIFAPTNDAFAAIPADQLEAVLADQELLTSILTYHVVAGESLTAADLATSGELTTVNGGTLSFGAEGTTVNDVNLVCSDVSTANATVHIIDAVLMPPMDDMEATTDESMEESMDESMDDSADAMMGATGPACGAVPADGEGSFAGMADDPAATAASNNPLLSTLVAAVSQAGLVDTLNGEGPFTIFAPTNDAFAAIPADQLEAVLADTDLLTSILTFHVVAGEQLSSQDLIDAGTVTTVNGGDLTITMDGETAMVNGASSVICMDVPTANATVHIIDGVLLPS